MSLKPSFPMIWYMYLQINVYLETAPRSCFLMIHSNIIFQPTPRLPNGLIPASSQSKSWMNFSSPIRATCPANLKHTDIIGIKFSEYCRSCSFSLRSFLWSPVTFSLLLQHPILSLYPSLHTRDQLPRSCIIPGKTVALSSLVLMLLDNKQEDKNYSGPNCSQHSPILICC